MKFQLPTYEFTIDDSEESGVNTISLVTAPAMKSSFIAFDEMQKKPKYIFIQKDGYKGIVAGLSMIPMQLIYRIADDGEEYNGYFTAETIEKIRNKYHKTVMNLKSVNLEHSDAFVDAYLVESYILDTPAMVDAVRAKGIEEATLGSWFTAFKVENKEVFQACVNGVFNGFSVEAFLDRELKMSVNNFNKNNTKKMKKNLIERLKEKVYKILEEVNFEDALCPDLNMTITWGAVGEKVTKTYINAQNAEVTEPITAGEFTLEDGRVLVVDANSMLTEVRPAVEVPVVEEVPPVDVPPVSGDTSIIMPVDVPFVETAEELACKKKLLEDAKLIEAKLVDGQPPVVPVEVPPVVAVDVTSKTLGELVDVTKDGTYDISVTVLGGVVTEAKVSAEQELVAKTKLASQELISLKEEIANLKTKLAAPIAEPVLRENLIEVTAFSSNYEKVAKRNGLQIM